MIRLQDKTVEIAGISLRCVIEGKGRPILVIGSSVYYPKTFSQDLRNSYRITYVDLSHFVQFPSGFQKEKISSLVRMMMNLYEPRKASFFKLAYQDRIGEYSKTKERFFFNID